MFYVCIKQQLKFRNKAPIGISVVVKLKQFNMPGVVNNNLLAGVSGKPGNNIVIRHQQEVL